MRKLKAIAVSSQLLLELMTDGYEIGQSHFVRVDSGVPDGSTVVGSFTDNNSMTGYLVVQHESFAALYPGEKIPTDKVTLSAHYPDPALKSYIQRIYDMNDDSEFRALDYSDSEQSAKQRYFLEKMLAELGETDRVQKSLPCSTTAPLQ